MIKSPLAYLVFAAVLPMLTGVSQGAVNVYSDYATWLAQTTGPLGSENFDTITPFTITPNAGAISTGLLSTEFVKPESAGGNAAISSDSGLPASVNGSTFLNLGIDGNPKADIIIYFPSAVRAFGFDYRFGALTDPATTVIDGNSYNFGGRDATGFVGYISDTPLTSFTVRDPFISVVFLGMDNVQYGEAIPEPGTATLITMAFAAMGWRKRRK